MFPRFSPPAGKSYGIGVFVPGIALFSWWACGKVAPGLRLRRWFAYGLCCAVASLALPFAGARLRRREEIGSAARTSIRFGPAILVGTMAAFALRAAG